MFRSIKYLAARRIGSIKNKIESGEIGSNGRRLSINECRDLGIHINESLGPRRIQIDIWDELAEMGYGRVKLTQIVPLPSDIERHLYNADQS